MIGEHAREVAGQAAARDVAHRVDGHARCEDRLNVAWIEARRGEQRFADRLATELVGAIADSSAAARRRGRGARASSRSSGGPLEASPMILSPSATFLPSMIFAACDDAHREAGEIVFALRVHAGQLGSLTAEEGAAGLLAGVRDALHDVLRDADVELAGPEVVEEEERRAPVVITSLTHIATRS